MDEAAASLKWFILNHPSIQDPQQLLAFLAKFSIQEQLFTILSGYNDETAWNNLLESYPSLLTEAFFDVIEKGIAGATERNDSKIADKFKRIRDVASRTIIRWSAIP
jgi:hypothetical protein